MFDELIKSLILGVHFGINPQFICRLVKVLSEKRYNSQEKYVNWCLSTYFWCNHLLTNWFNKKK